MVDAHSTIPAVSLRAVTPEDVHIFYEQHRDPEAARTAAFPPREKDNFLAHWQVILADPLVVIRTIAYEGDVAGNILSFLMHGKREVGYWLGRAYWGKGIASRALELFLPVITERPLYAYTARSNTASVRVLEKNGFVFVGVDPTFSTYEGVTVEGLIYRLDS